MTVGEMLTVALLGAILGLDVVSFPQAMLSRPIVAATAAGAVAGNVGAGLLLGAMLELIALDTLPVGASRYPEWGSASVVGGALFAAYRAEPAGALAMAMLLALATAGVGGWTMIALRRLNGVLARRKASALTRGSAAAVIQLQTLGLVVDFLRGGLLTFAALSVALPIERAAVGTWGLDPRLSRAVLVTAGAAVAGGAAWKLLHGTKWAPLYFLGGLGLGLSALLLS